MTNSTMGPGNQGGSSPNTFTQTFGTTQWHFPPLLNSIAELEGFPCWLGAKNPACNAGDTGSISGQRTKIPHALQGNKAWAPQLERPAWCNRDPHATIRARHSQIINIKNQTKPKLSWRGYVPCRCPRGWESHWTYHRSQDSQVRPHSRNTPQMRAGLESAPRGQWAKPWALLGQGQHLHQPSGHLGPWALAAFPASRECSQHLIVAPVSPPITRVPPGHLGPWASAAFPASRECSHLIVAPTSPPITRVRSQNKGNL